MKKERIEYYAHLTVTVLGIAILAYVALKYLFFLVLPFLIAWGVAFSLRPLARGISNTTKVPVRFISVALTFFIVVGGISLLSFAVAYASFTALNISDEVANPRDKSLSESFSYDQVSCI